jgi:hypothetical protein
VGPGRNNHVPLGPADGNAESSEPASRLRALVRVTLFTGKKISYRRRVAYNWALPARSHVHLTGLLLYLYCTATAMLTRWASVSPWRHMSGRRRSGIK